MDCGRGVYHYHDPPTTTEICKRIRTFTEGFVESLRNIPGKSAQALKPAHTTSSMEVLNTTAQLVECGTRVAGICNRCKPNTRWRWGRRSCFTFGFFMFSTT
jgi:hypothetical protein